MRPERKFLAFIYAPMALFYATSIKADVPAITAKVNIPYRVNYRGEGVGILPKLYTKVTFWNRLTIGLTVQIYDEKIDKLLAVFQINPKQEYSIREVITRKNYNDILIKCAYDPLSFYQDLARLESEKASAIEYRRMLYVFFWAVQQLYVSNDYYQYTVEILDVLNTLYSDDFLEELNNFFTQSTRPSDVNLLTEFTLRYLGERILTKNQQAVLALLEPLLRKYMLNNLAADFERIERDRQNVIQQFNDPNFVDNHTYRFKSIASDIRYLKELIPTLSLSLLNGSNLKFEKSGQVRTYNSDSNESLKFLTHFRIDKSLFKIAESKKNIFSIGSYFDYLRPTRYIFIDEFDFKYGGLGSGLALKFYYGAFAIVSLEGGGFISKAKLVSNNKNLSDIKIDSNQIDLQVGLSLQLLLPAFPVGVNVGLIYIDSKFRPENLNQINFDPEQLHGVVPNGGRFGLTYHFR